MDVEATIAATHVAETGKRTQPLALEPGDRVGRYVISRRLGVGSMGVVYVAKDPELHRDVALKIVTGSRSQGVSAERVSREARAIAQVNHPNVVVVNDVGRFAEAVFIAMELIDGQTLKRWLSTCRRSWQQILSTFLQAGEGLAAAHAAGLIHRDFKPDNVLVGDDGRVRVLDFGLARSLGGSAGTLPESAEVVQPSAGRTPVATQGSGTPAYMAPEQFEQRALGPEADQFSFCVALWEALYGQRPFQGDTFATIGAAVTLGRRRSPPSDAEVPRSVRRALDRGLERDPAARWPSMRALLDALHEAERGRAWALWVAAPVVASCVGLWLLAARGARTECEDGATRLAEVWSPQERAGLTAAIATSELPFADQTAQAVQTELDRYARGWVEAYDAACAASSSARMDCLDEGRWALASLGEAFRSPSASAIAGALEAARGLPPVAACESVTGEVQPLDVPTRVKVEQVRERIARAESMATLGDLGEAVEAMRAASADADAVVFPAVQIEAALALGRLESRALHFEAAERELRRAYFAALQAGAEQHAARAATSLVMVVGDGLGRFAEAQQWARHADAALDATGGERIRLWAARAVVHYRIGELSEAESLYERALERAQALGDSLEVAALSHKLALTHADRGAYERARSLHARGLQIREDVLGPDHPAVADSRVLLANLDQLEGRYDDALERYAAAESAYVATHGPAAPQLANTLYNVGRLRFMRGDLAAALDAFDRVLPLMERRRGPEHPMVATVQSSRSATLRRLGRLDEALHAAQQAEAIQIQTLGRDHVERAATLVSLANVYDLQGRKDEAMALQVEAERIFAQGLGPEHPMTLLALSNQAVLLTALDQPQRAVEIFERVIAIQRRTDADPLLLAEMLQGLGQALVGVGRPKDAVAPLREALELLEKASVEGQVRGETEMSLARALWQTGAREEAVGLADAAYDRFAVEDARALLDDANAWRKRVGLATRAIRQGQTAD